MSDLQMAGAQRNEQIILSADAASGSLALNEVRAFDPGMRLRRWLAPGIGWVELKSSWDALAAHWREQPPVFCRHVCPVQVLVPLGQEVADLDHLAAACRQFIPCLNPAQTFSVQTRLLGSGWPYARFDVNLRLSEVFTNQGVPLDVRQPEQVLSVILAPEQGYLGLSCAIDNVSNWAGGERRFKREKGQISRAEFKLLEAMELFRLSLPASGMALDLGAAPGGWTRILRQHSMKVVAVDPAELDPRISTDSAVRHIHDTAQRYLPQANEEFDVILNDMRMDARDSARLMVMASKNLRDSGWALLTLKLPMKGIDKVAASALGVMRGRYRIVGARQLFHNRSEITVALRHAGSGIRG